VGGRDDEDGVLIPQDLMATVGAVPRITLSVTNTTGATATLYGWIDVNHNGIFENPTERAFVKVPTATTNGRVTLTFPALPAGSAGTTYARFRLSADTAAANSTGAANGGEVEDYQFQIQSRLKDSFLVDYTSQFASGSNGLPAVSNSDGFGISVASLGDLDGNGMDDLAVGAPGDSSWRGAVYVLFRNIDGSVNHSVKIASSLHGGPALVVDQGFGASLASLGDIDGDGITDLAVGAYSNLNDELYNASAVSSVYIFHMNADGTAKSFSQLASQKNGIPQLSNGAEFCIVRAIGDIDGDGIGDIVIGAPGTAAGGTNRGAIYIVRLNANGTAKKVTTIANTSAWNPSVKDENNFGGTIASLGDIDHDGVVDLAVVSETGDFSGFINIVKLKPDGSLKSVTQLAMGDGTNSQPSLANVIAFDLENAGDINGDGVNDLVYSGSGYSSATGKYIGVVNTLLLNEDGTIKGSTAVVSLGGYVLDISGTYASITVLGPTADGDRQIAVTSPFVGTSGAVQANLSVLTLKNFPPVIPDATTVVGPYQSTEAARPEISWFSNLKATSYVLWVRHLSTGEIVVNSIEVTGTEYTPATDWGIGRYSVYVRAKSDAGVSAWSPRRDFTINTPIKAIPVADGMNPRPTLSWNPLAGAVQYDVWLANLAQHQIPVMHVKVDSTSTSFVPTNDLASGTYRLQVRGIAKDDSLGSWSQPTDFSIITAPTIISVSGQPSSRPDFSFTAIPGAVKYDTWISNLSNPAQRPIRITTPDVSTTFRPNVNLVPGNYRIWIRGVAADGSVGAWSRPKDFSASLVPQLTTSTSLFTLGDRIPLSWEAAEGAVRYELWYQGSTFGAPNHWSINVGSVTSYNFDSIGSIGRHLFWVRAVSADGRAGRWSNMIEVTVNAPVEFVRVSSTAGAFDRPTFTWAGLSGAASYEVRIDDLANNVTGWIAATNLVKPTYTSSVSLPLGTYSFQVRGIAKDGTVGEWSEPLMPLASQVPQLLPTDGNLTFKPQLQWTPVVGAKSYTFVVWNTDTGKPLGPSYDEGTTTATVPIGSEGRYSWSVRANGPGLPAIMSQPQTFVVTTRPVLTVPASFENNLATKTISWSAVRGEYNYEVWISTNRDVTVKQEQVSFRTTYNLSIDMPKGTYRVWVRAVSWYNALSPWSLPAVFEIT